jgi:hypothetical protein
MKNIEKQAMAIVAQLFDLAEVPVEKRQQINDTAYDYMLKQLRLHSVVGRSEQLVCPECKSIDCKVAIHTDYAECNECLNYWAN